MKKSIRISLAFASASDNYVVYLAILVIACLKNNAFFPSLPVSIADLTALLTAFQNAITAAAQGGTMATAAKNEARDPLVAALRQIAGYVQTLAVTLNLSQVLSSGFDVVSTNTAQSPLAQPLLTGLDNSQHAQLGVSLTPVSNARAYQIQYSVTAGTWLEGGIFPSSKGIVITDLTAGTIYTVRARGIGGSTQYSDWSPNISAMAT